MNPNQSAQVFRINVNPKGGVPKYRVLEAAVTFNGVAGDKQRDLRYHGGPSRAVSIYSYEKILSLQHEGHPIDCGTTGENLTLIGFNWQKIEIGSRLSIGNELEIELTSLAAPCKIIAASFLDEKFKRISEKLNPGWSRFYAKVIREGTVREGDEVLLQSDNFTKKELMKQEKDEGQKPGAVGKGPKVNRTKEVTKAKEAERMHDKNSPEADYDATVPQKSSEENLQDKRDRKNEQEGSE